MLNLKRGNLATKKKKKSSTIAKEFNLAKVLLKIKE
jgi:hypothetical protein